MIKTIATITSRIFFCTSVIFWIAVGVLMFTHAVDRDTLSNVKLISWINTFFYLLSTTISGWNPWRRR